MWLEQSRLICCFDVAHECRFIAHVMIGWENGYGVTMTQFDQAQERIQDSGGRITIIGLHHEVAIVGLPQQWTIERLMRTGENCDGTTGWNYKRYTAQGLLQWSLVAEEWTELFGNIR